MIRRNTMRYQNNAKTSTNIRHTITTPFLGIQMLRSRWMLLSLLLLICTTTSTTAATTTTTAVAATAHSKWSFPKFSKVQRRRRQPSSSLLSLLPKETTTTTTHKSTLMSRGGGGRQTNALPRKTMTTRQMEFLK